MTDFQPEQLAIRSLGPCGIPSPLTSRRAGRFVTDNVRLLHTIDFFGEDSLAPEYSFEKAGPRSPIFFNPAETRAAIVTCGGLCPGINNVIRSLYLQLHHNYGVTQVFGIRNGYQGLNPQYGHPLVPLTQEMVAHIHKLGGTILGTSRGPQDPRLMADFLVGNRISMLFCVGGDGTLRGAHALCEEMARRMLPIAIVGIPKTIDNDIGFVWQSFGYVTAVEKAREVLDGAHAEAKGAPNGVSIVKLMGREAGFIAAGATVASQEVNYTLVPEVPFELEGEGGFLSHLETRLLRSRHAVVVVAEGAGQHLLSGDKCAPDLDASGNVKFADIGLYLRDRIADHMGRRGVAVNVKYFDPSYIVRSTPANTSDSLLCDQLARHATHAAMAGKTDLVMGFWHNHFVHVPMQLVAGTRKRLTEDNELWAAVLETTGQPARFGSRREG